MTCLICATSSSGVRGWPPLRGIVAQRLQAPYSAPNITTKSCTADCLNRRLARLFEDDGVRRRWMCNPPSSSLVQGASADTSSPVKPWAPPFAIGAFKEDGAWPVLAHWCEAATVRYSSQVASRKFLTQVITRSRRTQAGAAQFDIEVGATNAERSADNR